MEYARLGAEAPPPIRLEDVVDTLPMARRKHPGAANNLDALCSRYGIDNSRRTKHGALLDAQILAEVYVELLGGKQTSLGLLVAEAAAPASADLPGLGGPPRAPSAAASPMPNASATMPSAPVSAPTRSGRITSAAPTRPEPRPHAAMRRASIAMQNRPSIYHPHGW